MSDTMKIPKAESKTVEFKTAFNQDAIVSLVAFANAVGGSVYVGVRDDGNVTGVSLGTGKPDHDIVYDYPVDAMRGIHVQFEDGGTWFQTVLRKKRGAPKTQIPPRACGKGGTLDGTLDGTLSPSIQRILDFVASHPGCQAREIIAELFVPRDTLNKIIKRLVSAGLVERRGGKRAGGYHARN
jgi:predicted HTH transcriptional regulator